MGTVEHSFTAVDRAAERQGEQADDFDQQLAEVTKRHAAAMRTNVLTGHKQTLEALAESLAFRLAERGNAEHLIRSALSCGPHTAGNQLLDMIDNCISDDAETAALAEMGRAESAGGLDLVAMRAAAAQEVRVPA